MNVPLLCLCGSLSPGSRPRALGTDLGQPWPPLMSRVTLVSRVGSGRCWELYFVTVERGQHFSEELSQHVPVVQCALSLVR